ncbi:MAG: ATP-dependent DNA helicase RecG [Candidatus Latescibacterota bacterium]|nr:ATP-dependent DNA helicase RecG [Candidatus Latescibacterota bacterium]
MRINLRQEEEEGEAGGGRIPILVGAINQIPVESVAGVGSRRGGILREAGVESVASLLLQFPRRYLDRSQVVRIVDVEDGRLVTVIGTVTQVIAPPPRRGRRPPTTASVDDDSGVPLNCVWFRGGQYVRLQTGDTIALSGRVEFFRGQRQVAHPEYEFVADESGEMLHAGRIVPLYSSSAEMKERGLRSRSFRRLIRAALDSYGGQLLGSVPADVAERHNMVSLRCALQDIHFPESWECMAAARRRLAFEELYQMQEALAQRRRQIESLTGVSLPPGKELIRKLREHLPFALTAAQERVLTEIHADLQAPPPMRRLLHGDVGSGKTIVALAAALSAMESGYQVALMAPTEILAEQHFYTIQGLLKPLGISPILFTGGQRTAVRRERLTGLQTGSIAIAVGTHALLQEDVSFANLGFIIVDEQHRFGVTQRQQLTEKGAGANLLIMTATPIPRSLALSVYGDLQVSVLDELPPGRKSVRTALRGPDRRGAIFDFVREQIREGRQAYVVYPVIDEAKALDLTSAVEGHRELCSGALRDCRVELLHGRMTAEEKSEVTKRFSAGEVDVLVATTVIEVGVDVPNVTVLVVEHAERFGLAQLHQLRGRVGRGAEMSYCILVAYPPDDAGRDEGVWQQRLQAICDTDDGFELARKDLELRGPGELLGARQAGVPGLRIANLLRDEELLALARSEVEAAA